VPTRLAALEPGIVRLKARLEKLNPPPVGPLPLLIGGEGEHVTLRVAAKYADMWNGFGPVEKFAHKSAVLDRWCEKVGRDPAEIERTVLLRERDDLDRIDEYVAAGAQHMILPSSAPFDLGQVIRLGEIARSET